MTAPPRHHTPRSNRPTRGPGVAAIAAAKGRPLMPWQRDAADVALELDPSTGLLHYGLVLVFVPRQAGKTTLESDVADHRCLTVPRARVWYTAQTGKDASAWMRDEHFASLERATVFGAPGTPRCRYRLSKRAGQEGVTWPGNGSTFRAFAPLRDALHGKQGDLVLLDEIWALSALQGADVRQAVRPTLLTRRGSQLWAVSTLGDDSSVFLDSYLELGIASLADPLTKVAIIDYGIPDDADPEDLDVIAAHHPAYGYTFGMDALRDARADFGDDVAGWARAYGNRPTRTRVAAIPPHLWHNTGRPRPTLLPPRVGLGLDVTPDGTRYAIAAAWRDGPTSYIELLAAGPITRETAPTLAQLSRTRRTPITLDRGALAALTLADDIAAHAGATIDYLNLSDFSAGCLTIERGVLDETLHHFHQPDLTAAVEHATKRPIGDGGYAWGRKSATGSIAELVAATVALRAYGAHTPPRTLTVLSART